MCHLSKLYNNDVLWIFEGHGILSRHDGKSAKLLSTQASQRAFCSVTLINFSSQVSASDSSVVFKQYRTIAYDHSVYRPITVIHRNVIVCASQLFLQSKANYSSISRSFLLGWWTLTRYALRYGILFSCLAVSDLLIRYLERNSS